MVAMLKRTPRQTSITTPSPFGVMSGDMKNISTAALSLAFILTALLLAAMFVGRGGGADGYPLPPAELFTNQDVLLVSLQGRTPVSPTPTPYSEASSIQIAPCEGGRR